MCTVSVSEAGVRHLTAGVKVKLYEFPLKPKKRINHAWHLQGFEKSLGPSASQPGSAACQRPLVSVGCVRHWRATCSRLETLPAPRLYPASVAFLKSESLITVYDLVAV